MRVYGVDPRRTTLRRIWVLLQRIPLGEWHAGDGAASWTAESYLLAGVLDAVNQLSWITASVHSKRKPKRPDAVTRPGTRQKKPKTKWTDLHKTLGVGENG